MNEWIWTSCQGVTKQGKQQNKRGFVLLEDKEFNYSAFPLINPLLNVMFIQHMIYIDIASPHSPWLPCLLYMIVGGKVADSKRVWSFCMCGYFSDCRECMKCSRIHNKYNAVCLFVCVLAERWGHAAEMSSPFSQSLYPSRSLQALFVPARDHMSQYLNSCRR